MDKRLQDKVNEKLDKYNKLLEKMKPDKEKLNELLKDLK